MALDSAAVRYEDLPIPVRTEPQDYEGLQVVQDTEAAKILVGDLHFRHESRHQSLSAPIVINSVEPDASSVHERSIASSSVDVESVGGAKEKSSDDKRIFGLRLWVFWPLIGLVMLLLVGGAVGGAIGVSRGSQRDANSLPVGADAPDTSDNSLPVPTPGTISVVKATNSQILDDNLESITYFFQDINSQDIYMTTFNFTHGWKQVGRLAGLNPPPKANSSFAALQAPNEATISIYYVSENGTLYDATGSPTSPDWQMGALAEQTRYSVLVSEDSGMAATWWGKKGDAGAGYRLRVYYVDRATSRVKELAFNSNASPQWFITAEQFETCSPKAKIAVAHLPAGKDDWDRETVHLFYQDRDQNLRHFPGYNGDWKTDNAETLSATVPDDAFITATIYVNETLNYPLRLWYIDASSRLVYLTGEGQSPKEDSTFRAKDTFSGPRVASAATTENFVTNAEVPGGSLGAVAWSLDIEQTRVFLRASVLDNGDKNAIAEIRGTTDWGTVLNEIEKPSD